MPEQTTTAARPQKSTSYMAPFEVEVSTHNSSQWRSMTLGETYRGRWSVRKLGSMTASASKFAQMPDIPGLRIKIIPKDKRVVIHDPLEQDPKLLQKISTVRRNISVGFRSVYEAVERREKTLTDDVFKTFVWEVYKSLTKRNPSLEVVSGQMPTTEQIEALPGRELYDYGSGWSSVKYVGDEDHINRLHALMKEHGIQM